MRSLVLALLLGAVACDGQIVVDGAVEGPDAGAVADVDADVVEPDAGTSEWVEGDTLADRDCPEDSLVTYRNFGSAFLSAYCTGCHSSQVPEGMRQNAPLGINLDTLEDVRALADRVYARSGDGYTTMPPAGSTDEHDRALLGEWLACGAPAD